MPLPPDFPTLETERLILREPARADAAAVLARLSDPEAARHLMRPLTSLRQAAELLTAWADEYRQGHGLTWALTCKPDPVSVGTVGYVFKADAVGEVNFDLARALWGQGLMREALRAVIDYGEGPLGLRVIEAYTGPGNTRARVVLGALGFQPSPPPADPNRWVLRPHRS